MTVAEFMASTIMNNKDSSNVFCNSQKRFFTPLRDLPTQIIEAVDYSSNSTIAFAFTIGNLNVIVDLKECSVAPIIRVGRSRRGVKTLFLNYGMHLYQKLCDLMMYIKIRNKVTHRKLSPLWYILNTLWYLL